ncbi:MAG: Phosphoribosyl pyrophosphate synthase [Patescibacteria group bacterium]|jgi:ribose-phosphate pyrophosphokinase|nr:Phosphoribosyl pyrophosphate synthase [Patescibacteria group bacterium]
MKKIAIISGSTHVSLAEQIAKKLGIELTSRNITVFANGEIDAEITETVSGSEVFIIQTSITGNVNDNFVESLLLIDAAKRARAIKVYLVQTIFPYQRQDRREANKKGRPKRKSVSAKVIANCYQKAVGVDGVVVVKLHSDQIEGFFDNHCIVENIDPAKLFINYLKENNIIRADYNGGKAPIMVAPDVGSAKSTDDFSYLLNLEYVLLNKRRVKAGESEVLHIVGDYRDRDCIIYDDMIDTGGTVINALEKLKDVKNDGAKDVYLMAPHGIFSKDAIDKLGKSDFKKIVITDSINNPAISAYPDKFDVIPLAPLLSSVIKNIHDLESLQSLVHHHEG